MHVFLLNEDIHQDNVYPCYFLHGEETFLAAQFIDELKQSLIQPNEDLNVERYKQREKGWMAVIDSLRNLPFFFSPWRIIVVEIPPENDMRLAPAEEDALKTYLSSPLEKTVMIIFFPGKMPKKHHFAVFLNSLPKSKVRILSVNPLKRRELDLWIKHKFFSLRKDITRDARMRLEELAGNTLGHLDKEIEKVVTFIGDRKTVELDDVNQVSGWAKTFVYWEIFDCLEKNDFQQGIHVLDKLLKKENISPENVVGIFAGFFRDLLCAKLWLRDGRKDKKEIFSVLKPQIRESYGSWYNTKFRTFFSLIEGTTFRDLKWFLKRLAEIDQKIKTSDSPPQPLLEKFLSDYSRKRTGNFIT
ncbi:MAG: DNA polymerase III subunit delta [Candidatus Aminicenantes bacterium]|nr:DNA polymerase III subunit delta [Candidatus Aminicenantes bacterium]